MSNNKTNDLLKDLSIDQIIDLMLGLGFDYPVISSSHPDQLIFNSLCHNDPKKKKLYYYHNEERKGFKCFVCGGSWGIFDMIIHIKKCDFSQALVFLREKCNLSIRHSIDKVGFGEFKELEDWDIINSFRTRKITTPIEKTYSDHILELFPKLYYQGWIDEYISIKTMEKYEIAVYPPQEAIVIPFRNTKGELIGIRRRSLNEYNIAQGYKYMPLSVGDIEYSHQTRFTFYGLYQNQETIKKTGKVILFESEKSVLQCETYYPDCNYSLALCGSELSTTQANILIKDLKVQECIIALDRDYLNEEEEKFKVFVNKVQKIAKRLCNYMNVYVIYEGMETLLPLKGSPSDSGKKILEVLMKTKTYIEGDDGQC